MLRLFRSAALATSALFATQASATLIDFETLAVGTTVANQFAALGAIFAPNAFTGPGGPTGVWATNTNMTVVSSTGGDVGGFGTPPLVSGNLLRSFNGWLSENGDPSFRITFTGSGISEFSAAFAGIATPSSTRLFVYDGTTLLSTVTATTTTGQQILSYAAAHITSVVITPGDFSDWVGVDNINFTPITTTAVPEPESALLIALGLGAIALARRRAMRSVNA